MILEVDSSANATVEELVCYDSLDLLDQPVEQLMPEDARRNQTGHRAEVCAHPTGRPLGSNWTSMASAKTTAVSLVDILLSPFHNDEG